MANITFGPKLQQLINANVGDTYIDALRAFLRAFDALVQATVLGTSVSTPPSSPSNGDAYVLLVASSPTGAWAGHAGHIAVYSTEITQSGTNTKTPGWEFHIPNPGFLVYSVGDNAYYSFTNEWRVLVTGGSSAMSAHSYSFSATPTFDMSAHQIWQMTLTGNVTSMTLANLSAGIVAFEFTQDATGGRTVAFPSNVKGAGVVDPTANATSTQTFISDGTNLIATGSMVVYP